MAAWTYILIAVDALFMLVAVSAVLYYLKRRPAGAQGNAADAAKAAEALGKAEALASELREELREAKRLSSELERKRIELQGREQSLLSHEARINEAVKRAEESVRKLDGLYEEEKRGNIYAAAARLASSGASQKEISERLGLLNGEAELISALNRVRH